MLLSLFADSFTRGGLSMSKMNIDEAFGVVCKYLDDYGNFLMMVKMMREAQKEFEDCPMENEADIQRLGKKAEVIETSVDNWLEKNM